MAAPPVSRAALARAVAARQGGATWPDAAAAGPIGERTLRRYMAGQGSGAPKVPSTAAGPGKGPLRARKRASRGAPELPPSPALDALEAEGEPAVVLDLLRRELGHACQKRAEATAAGNESLDARWSVRIEALAKVVERLEPPAPPSEDEVLRRLRALDGEALAMIELHLADRISPAEVAP